MIHVLNFGWHEIWLVKLTQAFCNISTSMSIFQRHRNSNHTKTHSRQPGNEKSLVYLIFLIHRSWGIGHFLRVKVKKVDNVQARKSPTVRLWSSHKNHRRPPNLQKIIDNCSSSCTVFSSARKCEVTISQKNIKPIFSIIFESILSQSKILF